MLCCVSRKLVNRPEFKNSPSVPASRSVSLTNTLLSKTNKSSSQFKLSFIHDNDDDDNNAYYQSETKDEPAALLPCSICGRTFKLQSLEKHTIICEKTVTKKRKPFDSSKQRIRGTELEEFLPKESTKKRMNDDKYKSSESWKETHNDFIKSICAAKVDTNNDTKINRQTVSSTTSGPPTRANDKGTCPTCNRQFGIKAYDRHVAWCKDRVTHVPSNAMTNVAKERLDARMKYRAPVLKNRRMTNREKYAPSLSSSTTTTTTTTIMNNNNNNNNKNLSSPGSIKPKESISLPNSCKIISSSSSNSYKPAVVRKISQGKNEGIVPSGPLKSRPSDRSFIRQIEDLQITRNQCPLLQTSHSSKIITNNNSNISINSSESSTKEWEIRGRSMSSIKNQKQLNIVSSRSRGNPKLNDVTVNTDVTGVMKVQPCTIEYKKINHDTTKKCIKSNNYNLMMNPNDDDDDDDVKTWINNCDKLDETYLIKENNVIVIKTADDDNNNNDVVVVELVKLTNDDTEEKVDVESLKEFVIDISRTSTPVAFDDKNDHNNEVDDDGHVGGGGDNKETLKFQELVSVNQQNDYHHNDNDDKKINNQEILKLNNEIEPLNLTVKLHADNSFKIIEKNRDSLKKINDLNNDYENSINITTDSLDSDRSHDIYLRKKLRKKMCYLRNSTDSLVSSIEAMPLLIKNKKQVDGVNKPHEIENNINSSSMMQQQQQHYRNKKSNRLTYLEQAIRNSKGRVYQAHRRMDLLKIDNNKNPKIPCVLPPIKKIPGKRNSATTCRPAWSNYVRRHPDFNLVLKGRTGMTQDYDPFLLAERQMNDLLSDTCSDDQSFPEFTNSQNTNTNNHNNDNNNINSNSNLSAFVKYPNQITLNSNDIDKHTSSIAQLPPSPPTQPTTTTTTNFDELSTGFSSDSTETNSISREILNDFELTRHKTIINNNNNNNNLPILGRKMIIDKSKALGKIIIDNNSNDTIDIINLTKNNSIIDRNNKSAKLSRSHVNRSNSVRASSAPKIPERNNSIVSSVNKASSRSISSSSSSSSSLSLSTSDFNKNNKNNYLNNLNGSNLSLSSIVSSDVVGGVGSVGNVGNVKRSNSLFEDLVCSFEDNVSGSYSSLRSFLKTDSLSSSSPVQSSIRPRNGQISDEDLSSPDSYNKKEHGKISLDSAYSSLNRKNYNCKLDEKNIKVGQHQEQDDIMSKMSKFCHQCGTKFPETAKFCCECGIRRLAI